MSELVAGNYGQCTACGAEVLEEFLCGNCGKCDDCCQCGKPAEDFEDELEEIDYEGD